MDALVQAMQRLSGSDSPRLDAELLLAHVLNIPRSRLFVCRERGLDAAETARFTSLIERRARGEPVAYLTGHWEFWSLPLKVTPDVLIPRPETELLVEWALDTVRSFQDAPQSGIRIADLGTGSGAIALALAKELPKAEIVAVDLSEAAMGIAQANAQALGISNLQFIQADFSAALDAVAGNHGKSFALIVSNPPYLAEGDPHLQALGHEPALALTAGVDGLDSLRIIVAKAMACLDRGGWLLVEHGYGQGPAARMLFEQAGYAQIATRRDLAGHERATGGCRP